ncbi:INO80 complex, subunit Ies4 [Boeremia exigua]|uniref:INO80 complex, subunit Ies4 n=1 Tax=Boeremia exigua TaxID=749465 RepID=UPI001E8D6E0F|nr:INO80 complex, subunit Ies4 [Boeremia exigua]KAH6642990.1 INO80 complex, subunit Ies4 [Boeremia exigua]
MSSKPTKTLTAVLKLSPKTLAQFPHEATPQPSPASKPASTPEASPAPQMADSAVADTPADTPAAMNGASTPSSLAPPGSAPGSKRKGAAPKAGTKRSAAALDGPSTPRARGKPGPKKRKLADIVNDPNSKTASATPNPLQKLGPKANQGAINAGLRALDRTGKFKARKWEKKGFKLRSFTGVVWGVPSWKAPSRSSGFADDVKSDSTGSSDTKIKDESSAVSEKSGLNGDAATPQPPIMEALNSSPAPMPVV